MLLRVVVREDGREVLPPIDVEGDFVISSDADARVRLPAMAIRGQRLAVRASQIGDGKTFVLGGYQVEVALAPQGASPTLPQRTESLARELVRGLLGGAGAPTLTIERGDHAGAKRALAPPQSVLVIGRGDEAGWNLEDEGLSRAHVELRRGWDGVRVVDLGSKNGTRVGGVRIAAGGEGVMVGDGAVIEIGGVVLRVADPAEAAMRAEASPDAIPNPNPDPNPTSSPRTRNAIAFWIALGVFALAVGGLVWLAISA